MKEYHSEVHDFAFPASWPLISLWHKIVTSNEDLEAEEVLDRVQQFLMCIRLNFKGPSIHMCERFRSCLARELSSLTNEKDPTYRRLSKYLFDNHLSEKIKQQLETSKITRRVARNNYEGRPSQGPLNRSSFSRRKKSYVKRSTYRRGQPCQGFQNRGCFQQHKQTDSDNSQKTFLQTHAFINEWKKLTDDQDVLQIVSLYYLEFDQEPMQNAPPTLFKLWRPEERLVDQEIKKLLKKGQ